jgi:hypothetical protein
LVEKADRLYIAKTSSNIDKALLTGPITSRTHRQESSNAAMTKGAGHALNWTFHMVINKAMTKLTFS